MLPDGNWRTWRRQELGISEKHTGMNNEVNTDGHQLSDQPDKNDTGQNRFRDMAADLFAE